MTCNSVDIGVTVTSDGGSPITSRGFYYGTSPSPTTNQILVSGTTGAMSTSLTGLAASTLYYYRAFATNSNGTTFLGDGVFTTPSCASINTAPTITPPSNQTNSCGGALISGINITVGDAESSLSSLMVSASSSNTSLLPNTGISIIQPNSSGQAFLSYTTLQGQT